MEQGRDTDRNERTAILEPILLILKQRTGVAFIASAIILLGGGLLDIEKEVLGMFATLAFSYIAGQKYVDSKEMVGQINEYVVELEEIIGNGNNSDNSEV